MLRNLNRTYSRGRVCGTPKSGIRGDLIPSTGTSGAPPLYNDVTLPGEAADEFRLYVATVPAGLVLDMDEDSSFTASGPDGTYTVSYDGYKNGVYYGTATFTITIGSGTPVTINRRAIIAALMMG